MSKSSTTSFVHKCLIHDCIIIKSTRSISTSQPCPPNAISVASFITATSRNFSLFQNLGLFAHHSPSTRCLSLVRFAMQPDCPPCINVILDVVQRLSVDFCIYISNYGINETVALPTITVVLPSVTTTTATSIIQRLQQMYNPFDFDLYTIRFSSGTVQAAGRAWFDPQVPLGASISAHEDYIPEPGAGTLGCYCSISGDDGMYVRR